MFIGLWGMYYSIHRTYFIPRLRSFLSGELKKYMVCNQTKVKPKHPPIAAIVLESLLQIWQFDYIGLFPPDIVRFILLNLICLYFYLFLFLENGRTICFSWN